MGETFSFLAYLFNVYKLKTKIIRMASLILKEENKQILFSSLKLSQLRSLFPAFVKSLQKLTT